MYIGVYICMYTAVLEQIEYDLSKNRTRTCPIFYLLQDRSIYMYIYTYVYIGVPSKGF